MAMARSADSGRVAFWQGLIERRRHSGLSVARLCGEVGVSPASFYQWQRKLRGRVARASNTQPDQRTASRLVPVHIVPDAPTGHAGAAGMLEIELPGEIRLRIPSGCDRATLQVVLSMLLHGDSRESRSC
jgi:hypothetical protein